VTITPEEIRRIAKLAELEIAESEIPRLAAELDAIVGYVSQLGIVESGTTGRFLPGPAATPLRPDTPGSVPLAIPPAELAPEMADGFFLVPRLGGREEE
jgi:aspartyl-tRNA(Asn)/glutamyl-tRNA(Gln) amidotransferase subunit C